MAVSSATQPPSIQRPQDSVSPHAELSSAFANLQSAFASGASSTALENHRAAVESSIRAVEAYAAELSGKVRTNGIDPSARYEKNISNLRTSIARAFAAPTRASMFLKIGAAALTMISNDLRLLEAETQLPRSDDASVAKHDSARIAARTIRPAVRVPFI